MDEVAEVMTILIIPGGGKKLTRLAYKITRFLRQTNTSKMLGKLVMM